MNTSSIIVSSQRSLQFTKTIIESIAFIFWSFWMKSFFLSTLKSFIFRITRPAHSDKACPPFSHAHTLSLSLSLSLTHTCCSKVLLMEDWKEEKNGKSILSLHAFGAWQQVGVWCIRFRKRREGEKHSSFFFFFVDFLFNTEWMGEEKSSGNKMHHVFSSPQRYRRLRKHSFRMWFDFII